MGMKSIIFFVIDFIRLILFAENPRIRKLAHDTRTLIQTYHPFVNTIKCVKRLGLFL